VSNGASIVLEQAAARPEASVFLRPSVMADEDCCLAVDLEGDDDATVATFALAPHPPPLGTVCKFKLDGAFCGMMESFAYESCTESNKRHSAMIDAVLLGEAD